MPHLDIRIHRCNEKEPAWPNQKVETELKFGQTAILEQGTTGGNASITFALTDPATGKVYAAQLTAGLLDMLYSAVKGAKEHWLENPVENVWK
jgi:ABC-type proline/glycine betaine transport system substrate-binding protein